MKGSATPGGITGWRHPKAGGLKHPLRREVHLAPDIHDATGEQINVGSRRLMRPSSESSGRKSWTPAQPKALNNGE